jgi:hypothetical protein
MSAASRPNPTLFSNGGVVVTTSRITINGDNYFINQIASSKMRYTDHINTTKSFLRKMACLASLAAGVLVGFSANSAFAGACIIVAGLIASFMFIKPGFRLYHVYLGMSSGEVDAFRSGDEAFVRQISNAINEALASRA